MATDVSVSSTHTTERSTPDILTRRAGVFWGATLFLLGIVWFLEAADVINLSDKFPDLVVPFMLIIVGIYLLAMKLGK